MEVEQENYHAARKLFEVEFNTTSSILFFFFCFFFLVKLGRLYILIRSLGHFSLPFAFTSFC